VLGDGVAGHVQLDAPLEQQRAYTAMICIPYNSIISADTKAKGRQLPYEVPPLRRFPFWRCSSVLISLKNGFNENVKMS
jgi:hypothetical protein